MAKKNETPEAAVAAPEPDASPAVLQRVERVRFIGAAPFSAYLREPLPPHGDVGDTFEIERQRAVRLARYYPDRYELVRSEPTEEG